MICEHSWYSAQNLLNLKCQGKYETVATEFPFVGLEYWELRKWRRKRTHSCVFFWPGESPLFLPHEEFRVMVSPCAGAGPAECPLPAVPGL